MDKAQTIKGSSKADASKIIANIMEALKNDNIIKNYHKGTLNKIFIDETTLETEECIDVTLFKTPTAAKKQKNILDNYIKRKINSFLPYAINTIGLIIAADNKRYALFNCNGQIGERIRNIFWDSTQAKSYHLADHCILLHRNSPQSSKDNTVEHKNQLENFNQYQSYAHSINSLDEILTDEELYWKLINISINSLSKGAQDDARGNVFEKFIINILTHEPNWEKWNSPGNVDGFMYDVFEKIISKLTNSKNQILDIKASKDIPDIENHGKPKTDLYIQIKFKGNTYYDTFTVSVKCSKEKYVSAHEYSADSFFEALDLKETDRPFMDALLSFQSVGAFKKLKPSDYENLKNGLQQHSKSLYNWVIKGECVNPSRFPYTKYPNMQIANYLLCYNYETGSIHIHTANEYIDWLQTQNDLASGTPLSFTYPSKNKNKKIQVKIPINFDN